MKYEEALQLWGAKKLSEVYPRLAIDSATVHVGMQFDKGYVCCGGRDPDCYCSRAESPSASVRITAWTRDMSRQASVDIDAEDFDFATVLSEIIAVSDGALTA